MRPEPGLAHRAVGGPSPVRSEDWFNSHNGRWLSAVNSQVYQKREVTGGGRCPDCLGQWPTESRHVTRNASGVHQACNDETHDVTRDASCVNQACTQTRTKHITLSATQPVRTICMTQRVTHIVCTHRAKTFLMPDVSRGAFDVTLSVQPA